MPICFGSYFGASLMRARLPRRAKQVTTALDHENVAALPRRFEERFRRGFYEKSQRYAPELINAFPDPKIISSAR
jgi:hypothetical protein